MSPPRTAPFEILLVLLFAATQLAAAAAPVQVEASLSVSGSTQFSGSIDASLRISGAICEPLPGDASIRFAMRFDAAHVTLYNFPYTIVGDPKGPVGSNATLPLPEERVWERTSSGTLKLTEIGSRPLLMVFPRTSKENLTLHPDAPVQVTITPSGTTDPFETPNSVFFVAGRGPRALVPRVPAGVLTDAMSSDHRLHGPTVSLVYGATFDLTERDGTRRSIVTGEQRNTTATATDPSGTFGERKYDRFALLIESDQAETIIGSDIAGRWRLALRGSDGGTWDGDFSFAGPQGRILADGRELTERPQHFQIIGSFQGQTDYSTGTTASWEMAGPATFVGLDGLTVAGVRPGGNPAVAVATAAGLGLLIVVYVAFSWVRRGAVYVGVKALEWKLFTFTPFAARLDLAKILEHPIRRAIMDMLAGAHAMRNLAELRKDVAAAHGISTTAAYFHLRTLWQANHLTVVRLQGRHYVGPNSGGMGPKEQRVAASLLQHPVGLAIAEYLCRHPGAAQKELLAHAAEASTKAGRTLSKGALLSWVRKFERVKLVPTHLVRAFGTSLNPGVDAGDVHPVPVSLVTRRSDPKDARIVRYEATDVLFDVVKTFLGRRPDLGTALTELTRMRVVRRNPGASQAASVPATLAPGQVAGDLRGGKTTKTIAE